MKNSHFHHKVHLIKNISSIRARICHKNDEHAFGTMNGMAPKEIAEGEKKAQLHATQACSFIWNQK